MRNNRVEFTFADPNEEQLKCSMKLTYIPQQRQIDKILNDKSLSLQQQYCDVFDILGGKLYHDGDELPEEYISVTDKTYAVQAYNDFLVESSPRRKTLERNISLLQKETTQNTGSALN